MDTRYDDDGYYTSVPVLILTTRENVQLPAGTTEADIATLREMLHPNSEPDAFEDRRRAADRCFAADLAWPSFLERTTPRDKDLCRRHRSQSS